MSRSRRHGVDEARAARLRRLVLIVAALAVLLLAFASVAAARSGAWSAPAWGPGLGTAGHESRAALVHGPKGARRLASRHSPATSVQTGTIEGKVTDAATKVGVGGIEVCAWPLGAGEEGEEELEELAFPCSTSSASGSYALHVPEGEYAVEFSTPFNSIANYVTQYYDDSPSFEEATPLIVQTGAIYTANAAMVHGGSVSGKVTAAEGGAAIEGVEICAWGVGVESVGCAETGASGEYLVTGLAPGKYKVGFRSPPKSGLDYVAQFYADKSSFATANEIEVAKEATTPNIGAAMQLGGRIGGTVTAAASGSPAAGVFVCAFNPLEGPVECALTGTDGRYTISALPPEAHYKVGFEGGPQFEVEYYKEAFTLNAASELTVTKGGVLAGIDAALVARALPPQNTVFPTISGTIAVGSTVSCSPGSWSGATPMAYTYQWLRDRVAIEGATATSYTIQTADVGHFVACEVIAYNRKGNSWARSIGYRVPAPLPVPTGVTPVAPPPPKAEVLPSIVVVPAASAASRVKVSRSLAKVRVSCKAGPCHGTVQLLATIRQRRRVGGHTVVRRVTVVLGSAGFSLASGASANVTIHLNAAGRHQLAGAARHPRQEKLKLLLHGGATTMRAVTVG